MRIASAWPFVRTLLNSACLLFTVVVLNFFLIQAAPGDPALVIAGEMGGASPEIMARIRVEYGLDRGVGEQLAGYLTKTVHGDLGYSFYFNQPVLNLVLRRAPATILLMVSALTIAVLVGTGLGIVSSRRPRGAFSQFISAVSTAGFAAPVFWTGLMLLVLFASVWPVLPVAGMANLAEPASGLAYVVDVARHLVLPASTLAIVYVAQYTRLTRTSMIEALQADYVRTARAKGVPEYLVILKHALRNALVPLVTIVGLQIGQIFAGAVLVETVFAWPGLGRLAFDSILRRDYPTLLGILLFSAILVVVANLLTDWTYRLVDPRIRVSRA